MIEEELFHRALEKPSPAERLAFLDQVCANQPELRERIERLLRSHGHEDSFLHAGVTTEEPPTEKPGTVIGPYKLLQQIGEGGMGVVWMAEQTEPVKRKVALKVIKPGMDSRQVIARFEAERQALALMDHVNIARVFDGGTTDSPLAPVGGEGLGVRGYGRPYFVMELVHGVPITKYCDDNHLTPRERLELFVPVCQAIQHAHQKGIIHRDIKPSNVMVTLYDGKPVPKVIDFGVAKATEQKLTERTLFTQYGTMVGTLEYMSPEQAEMSALGVDTRSDIYSLGVLLYELLTGSTPLTHERMKEAAYAEILRLIKEEEPPKPSTRLSDSGEALASISANRHTEPAKLTKLVKGELDWIVMKCLEKDRNRRYETANGFAQDVQRYLADEQVLACPPSAGYRLRKFMRRNKGPVIAASLIVLALVGGIIGTSIGLIRAEEQRQIADAEKKKAEQAEADTLADYRASTDDAIEQLIGSKADLGPQEKAYLEKTLKRWQAFASRQGDDERSQAIRAEGHHRVANLWARLGQHDAARPEYETARDLYKSLAASFPAVSDHQHELARTHHNLGLLLAGLGQTESARTEFKAARDLQKKLADSFPDVPSYQQKLALTHSNLGALLTSLGQREAARTEHQTAHAIRKKLAAAFPAVPDYQQELATTHSKLGRLLRDLGQSDAARREYQTARDLYKKLADTFPAVPKYQASLANSHVLLGNLLYGLRQVEAARTEFETARDLRKKLADAFPALPDYQHELATTHNNVGNVLLELDQRDAARMELETARDLRKKLADAFPAVPDYQQELATTHNNLGTVLKAMSLRDAARTEYETARDLQKKLIAAFPAVPAYRQELARTHNNLGNLLKELGQLDAARAELETARDLKKKLADAFPAVPEYQVDLGGSYADLGNLVRDEGQPADSLHWYDLAIRTLTPVYEKDPRAVRARLLLRDSHSNRATAYADLKKYAEAARDWDKAIELDPNYVIAHSNLGLAFYHQGKFEKAIAAYQQAIKLDPKNAGAYSNLALALVELGDPKKLPEAVNAAEKAVNLLPKDANAHSNLGNVLGAQKKLDAAAAAYQKAIDLDPKHPNAHSNLGTVYGQQGKLDQAIASLRKALEINPTNVNARIKLGIAYNKLGIDLRNQKKLNEAIEAHHKAIELNPKYANAYRGLGDALKLVGKLDDARAAYRKWSELDPNLRAVHTNLAWWLATDANPKFRDPKAAVTHARKALELASDDPNHWSNLGVALWRAGDLKTAIETLEKADRMHKNGDLEHRLFLAMAYWQIGEKDKARRAYDQAVEWMDKHRPKNEEMRRFRAEAEELLGVSQKKM